MPEPMPPVAGLPSTAPIPAAATLTDELAAALAPRVARLGYLGGFFAVGARVPAALSAFMAFTEALKVAVPPDLAEIVALRAARILRNEYEEAQHIALANVLGLGPDWVSAALTGDREAPCLSNAQRATLGLVAAQLTDAGHGAGAAVTTVDELCGPDLTVAIVLLISRYVAHAHASNAFQLVNPLAPPERDIP